jgi:hypothetical protein
MATVRLCDRCGKRMPADRALDSGRVITAEPGECFDLCNRCYVKFKEFMRGRELMPDPRDALSVVLGPGDHVKDLSPACAPVRNDGESGPAGSPAPTREMEVTA